MVSATWRPDMWVKAVSNLPNCGPPPIFSLGVASQHRTSSGTWTQKGVLAESF